MNAPSLSEGRKSTWRECAATQRRILRRLWFGAVMFQIVLCSPSFAQSYSLDWFTMDGGGGTSTGGVYSISGTIGQPDAGPRLSGGGYAVEGGFWGMIAAVATPGAPLLSIFATTTNTVVVSWPSPSTGFNLQVNTDLSTTNWASAGLPMDNGTNKFLIVNPPVGNRFYRLANP